jgi:hypothetical protein
MLFTKSVCIFDFIILLIDSYWCVYFYIFVFSCYENIFFERKKKQQSGYFLFKLVLFSGIFLFYTRTGPFHPDIGVTLCLSLCMQICVSKITERNGLRLRILVIYGCINDLHRPSNSWITFLQCWPFIMVKHF